MEQMDGVVTGKSGKTLKIFWAIYFFRSKIVAANTPEQVSADWSANSALVAFTGNRLGVVPYYEEQTSIDRLADLFFKFFEIFTLLIIAVLVIIYTGLLTMSEGAIWLLLFASYVPTIPIQFC